MSPGADDPIRAVVSFSKPVRVAIERRDWMPPYTVRQSFAPVPSWVRGARSLRP